MTGEQPAGSAFKRFLAGFVRIYLTADVRALAAGRIVLALALLLDLGMRSSQLSVWYTNEGLLPNHTILWRPPYAKVFSFFFMASYRHEAVVGFIACGIAYTALLLGLRTRVAQIASLVCVLSLHSRALLCANGGDVVLGLLCLWTTFLPTGRVGSVDSLLAGRGPAKSVASVAVLALTLQLAVIYFFNAVHKNGAAWRDDSAVHYALHIDRLVTPFGAWLRDWMPTRLARALTWASLRIERTLSLLLISPLAVRGCRRLSIALIVLLHLGFGLCLNLGIFVPAMLAFTPNLLRGEDWDGLQRWWSRDRRRVRLTTHLSELWSRLVRGAYSTLSPGRWVRVAGPGRFMKAVLDRLPIAREVAAAAVMFVAANQLFDENPAAHYAFDHHNSPRMTAVVTYLNLLQGWFMFAPNPPTTNLNVVVDGVTVDGRHVDPLNEMANPRYPAPGMQIPRAMGTGWMFYGYEGHALERPEYFQAFREWLLRYPSRTGRNRDQLVSFRVFTVEEDSPPLGERLPRNLRWTLLFQYP